MTGMRSWAAGLLILAGCGEAEPEQPQTSAPTAIQIVGSVPDRSEAPTPLKGDCSTFELVNVIGQPYSQEIVEQARQSSKARAAVVVKVDGVPIPADRDRLTIAINANQTIIDARCG